MKRIVLIVLLSFFSVRSFSQAGGMYGAGVGLGFTTTYHPYITGTVSSYYLWKLTQHIYAGGTLALNRYSFRYDMGIDGYHVKYYDVISIRQKATYLFFSPTIDYGTGYRKRWHISVSGGAGVIMASHQEAAEYIPRLSTPAGNFGADTAGINMSYNVPRVAYRAGIGVSKRIPTGGLFNIMVSLNLDYIPTNLNLDPTTPFHTQYLSFTVGITHKYPQVRVEYY